MKKLTARKKFTALALAAAFTTITACGSDDDDDGGSDGDGSGDAVVVSEPGTFQVSFTNMTDNHLMTPPVVALHDPSAHLFQVGETASDAIKAIAETGDNAPLVAFAGTIPDLVSGAGVAGAEAFGPGGEVMTTLSTALPGQVLSAVNMVICTNDGIAGFDSIELPADNNPVTMTAIAYDAGTRENSNDAQSFFPGPCRVGDVVPNAETDPRAAIAVHPGQTVVNNNTAGPGPTDNWNVESGAVVLQMTVTRN